MKKTLFALLALALTASAAAAQTTTIPNPATTQPVRGQGKIKKSPAQKADRHAAKMAKSLGLTADQEAKVESILLAQSQEMTTLKAKYASQAAGSRQAARPEAQALRAKYDAQLQAALGPDAYARYDKMRDERRGKMKEHGNLKMKAKS